MAAPAFKRMSIADFLEWNPPGDTHYQLLNGVPVAIAPPAAAHRIVAGNLQGHLFAVLAKRPPCTVQPQAGIALWHRDTWYEADLAVTCRPHEFGQQEMPEPILIAEVLSPSTESHDLGLKLADYRRCRACRRSC